ncbi:DUF1365 domain-containing protein [Novosphingobium sp. UBA1939]|uniref:DUF1365 domain-containing protein n=1 Tax=Novosphingobium sp. UBA1939 TaxID=1946982 RepID=UPI0025D02E09|nr:DUF1365 family protein [Novosphingobium sp. UBA1939]
MTASSSALYIGDVTHRRLRPRPHRLRYSIFYLLLDLDEVDVLAGRLRIFSHNRFNLFSFFDRDYGDGSAASPREKIEEHLRAAGIETGGPIRLLTMPRILGYAFNPLSVYFCHRQDGSLCALFYEVSNTFGQRHSYLIPVPAGATAPIRQESRKSFYVSPFISTDMAYSFAITPPGERVAVYVAGHDEQGPLITARLAGRRQGLTDAALARLFITYPLLTLKVIIGIHWEALRLWLKGVRLFDRPPPPDRPVTLGHGVEPSRHPERKSGPPQVRPL